MLRRLCACERERSGAHSATPVASGRGICISSCRAIAGSSRWVPRGALARWWVASYFPIGSVRESSPALSIRDTYLRFSLESAAASRAGFAERTSACLPPASRGTRRFSPDCGARSVSAQLARGERWCRVGATAWNWARRALASASRSVRSGRRRRSSPTSNASIRSMGRRTAPARGRASHHWPGACSLARASTIGQRELTGASQHHSRACANWREPA